MRGEGGSTARGPLLLDGGRWPVVLHSLPKFEAVVTHFHLEGRLGRRNALKDLLGLERREKGVFLVGSAAGANIERVDPLLGTVEKYIAPVESVSASRRHLRTKPVNAPVDSAVRPADIDRERFLDRSQYL
jgi:hypothetical protein